MTCDHFSGCTVDSVKKIKYLVLILEKTKNYAQIPQNLTSSLF